MSNIQKPNEALRLRRLRDECRIMIDQIREKAGESESLERRIRKLEGRLTAMVARQRTLYNRYYAQSVRRTDAENRMLQRTKRWAKDLAKLDAVALIRLGKILSGLEKDKHLLLFTGRERCLLRSWLERKKAFARRRRNSKSASSASSSRI